MYTIVPKTEISPVAQTQPLWQTAVATLPCIKYGFVKNIWHSSPSLIARWDLGWCCAREMRQRCCLFACSHAKRKFYSYRMPWEKWIYFAELNMHLFAHGCHKRCSTVSTGVIGRLAPLDVTAHFRFGFIKISFRIVEWKFRMHLLSGEFHFDAFDFAHLFVTLFLRSH